MDEHEPPANNIYQLEEFLNRTRGRRVLWPKKNRLVQRANTVARRGNVTLELPGDDQSVKLARGKFSSRTRVRLFCTSSRQWILILMNYEIFT